MCEERGMGWGCEYWVWYMADTASPKVGASVYKGGGGRCQLESLIVQSW